MKLSKDCGANIGRHYYEENYEVLEKMLDEFSSRTYENMNDDEKTKINDLILSRKKEFENLDMTKLNMMLQHLFGDIITLPEKWWLDYDLLEKLNGTYEEYIKQVTIIAHEKGLTYEGTWEEILNLSPSAANERIVYIVNLIDNNKDEIEYIKHNIHCAIKYRLVDKNTIYRCLRAWANYVLNNIRAYIYDYDRLRTFDDNLDYTDQEDGWRILYSGDAYEYWDMNRALTEEGFVNKYR